MWRIALLTWLSISAVAFYPQAYFSVLPVLIASVLVSVGIYFLFRQSAKATIILALIIMAAGGLRFGYEALQFQQSRQQLAALDNQIVNVTGRVEKLISADQLRQLVHFKITGNDQRLVDKTIRLSWYRSKYAFSENDHWQFAIKLKLPYSFLNPGSSDYPLWLNQQGLIANAYVVDRQFEPVKINTANTGISGIKVREKVADFVNTVLAGEPHQAMFLALANGDKGEISAQQWRDFQYLGLTHLLAISGLHMGIVAGLAYWLASFLWRLLPPLQRWPRIHIRVILAVLAATGYGFLADWSIPTQRAWIMILALALPSLFRWSVSVWQRLSLALIAILLWQPWVIFSPGLYLSFVAVIAIVLLAQRVSKPSGKLMGKSGWLWFLVKVQLALFLALLPLSVYVFQTVAVGGIVANLVMVPLFTVVVVPVVLMASLLSFIPVDGLNWLAASALFISHELLELCVQAFQLARLDELTLILAKPTLAIAALATISGLLLLIPLPLPLRVFCLLVYGLIFVPVLPKYPVDLTLLDVGQGQALVFRDGGDYLLYDTGPKLGKTDAAALVIQPYFRQLGVTSANDVVISHDDLDHAGGWPTLKQQWGAEKKRKCTEGDTWQYQNSHIQALHPPADFTASDNNRSCVLLIETMDKKILLTGDIEASVERRLLSKYAALLSGVDIVTVPHHGSKSSSTLSFVNTVAAKLALVSVGRNNRFGMPVADIVQRYVNAETTVLRSDELGAVTMGLNSDGIFIRNEREQQQKWRPWWRPADSL